MTLQKTAEIIDENHHHTIEAEMKNGQTIIPTPTWVLVVRVGQILLSIISLGLSGWWVHGLYANPLGFAIVCVCFQSSLTISLGS